MVGEEWSSSVFVQVLVVVVGFSLTYIMHFFASLFSPFSFLNQWSIIFTNTLFVFIVCCLCFNKVSLALLPLQWPQSVGSPLVQHLWKFRDGSPQNTGLHVWPHHSRTALPLMCWNPPVCGYGHPKWFWVFCQNRYHHSITASCYPQLHYLKHQ